MTIESLKSQLEGIIATPAIKPVAPPIEKLVRAADEILDLGKRCLENPNAWYMIMHIQIAIENTITDLAIAG